MTERGRQQRVVRVVLMSLAGAGLCAGCASTRKIERSALVPAIAPPTMTGQPIDNGRARLTLTNGTYLRSKTPRENEEGTNAGLYIPRTQFGLQALFRIGRNFSLGPKAEIGLNQGARPIAENMGPKPSGATFAIGPAFQYSLPLTRHFRLGFGVETLLAFTPYEKITTFDSGVTDQESSVDATVLFGLGLIPSFRWGPVVAFAGIAGRNQPTITKDEIRSNADLYDGDDVRAGPMYLVTFGGLQVRLLERLELTTEIYYPVTNEPVDYGGPALSVSLGVALGQPWRPRRRVPVYSVPPPPTVQPPAPAPSQPPPPATSPSPAGPVPQPAPTAPDEPVDIQ